MKDKMDEEHQVDDIVKTATFEINDEVSGDKLKVVVFQDAYGLKIKPEGYGNDFAPVSLDFFSGSEDTGKGPLSVLVWSNPEEEEPTHKIPLDLMKNYKYIGDKEQ